MAMKLFHLTRDDTEYGVMSECVVIAGSEETARAAAAASCGDEGPDVWTTDARCEEIRMSQQRSIRIVCRSINAG